MLGVGRLAATADRLRVMAVPLDASLEGASLAGMSGGKDVNAKLGSADEWVRDEFGFVSDLMAAVDCDSHDESGPGRSFHLDGPPVLRVHPKLRYIALGFPDRLRADVEALTHALRPQKGAAWLNYGPGLCDRDTIEILVDKSLRAVSRKVSAPSRAGRAQTPASPPSVSGSRLARDDEADLALILAVLRAFKAHEDATGARSGTKVLREAIFFHWEGPRLPAGGKYSPLLPHSQAARERRALGHRDGFVFEHVLPVSIFIRQLLADVPANEAMLRTALEASPERVIITKTEDNALSAAGMRNVAPAADDVWSRYRAAGLDPSAFAPIEG
jgi:hypothetical protein